MYACTQGQTLVHTCKISEVRARQWRMRVSSLGALTCKPARYRHAVDANAMFGSAGGGVRAPALARMSPCRTDALWLQARLLEVTAADSSPGCLTHKLARYWRAIAGEMTFGDFYNEIFFPQKCLDKTITARGTVKTAKGQGRGSSCKTGEGFNIP